MRLSLACCSPWGRKESGTTERLNNKYTYMCTYILYSRIYHIFFIHSSADGQLGYFHILAIVNNAAVNIGCMYRLKLVFWGFFRIYTQLSHMVVLFLVFWEASTLFFCISLLFFRYASLKKQIVFEISLKSCSIPSVPFFPYAFSGEGLRHFKSLELHKLLYLWRSSQFNVSFCLLCFLHPGSCLQRLEQTQLPPL